MCGYTYLWINTKKEGLLKLICFVISGKKSYLLLYAYFFILLYVYAKIKIKKRKTKALYKK